MKPRSTWTGYLKISLVTVPVRVYTALNGGEKITFNQLHNCHQRVRQKLVCPVHGEVERESLVKGHEYAEGKFVILDEADLEKVRLEATATLDLVQFVRSDELDPLLLDVPYYVGPDGPVAEEGFGVLREALRRANLIGIGRVVLSGKEKLVALKPVGKGFVFFVLRYAEEVRPANDYFQDLPEAKPDETQVAMAQKLIASKAAPFNHATFTDRHQALLLDIIKAKIQGTEPVLVARNEVAQVISLMDALRQSVAQSEHKPVSGRNGAAKPILRNGNGNGSRLAPCSIGKGSRSAVPMLKEPAKR